MKIKLQAKASPKSNDRACLCSNGTYSRKCCDGSLWAQGIGNITVVVNNEVYTRITQASDTRITQDGNTRITN